MGSTSSVSIVDRPSRLKSLESEFSPVLTMPPPVEPNTVFDLMSVPEMMLSSKLEVLRRRSATMPPTPASNAMPPAIQTHGGLAMTSSMNEGSAAGFATGLVGAFGAGAAVAAAGAAPAATSAFGGSALAVSVLGASAARAGSGAFATGSGTLTGAGAVTGATPAALGAPFAGSGAALPACD